MTASENLGSSFQLIPGQRYALLVEPRFRTQGLTSRQARIGGMVGTNCRYCTTFAPCHMLLSCYIMKTHTR
jgi:hypothetical protein